MCCTANRAGFTDSKQLPNLTAFEVTRLVKIKFNSEEKDQLATYLAPDLVPVGLIGLLLLVIVLISTFQSQAYGPPVALSSLANTVSMPASNPPVCHDLPISQASHADARTSIQAVSTPIHRDRLTLIQARSTSSPPHQELLSNLDNEHHGSGSNRVPLALRSSRRSEQGGRSRIAKLIDSTTLEVQEPSLQERERASRPRSKVNKSSVSAEPAPALTIAECTIAGPSSLRSVGICTTQPYRI